MLVLCGSIKSQETGKKKKKSLSQKNPFQFTLRRGNSPHFQIFALLLRNTRPSWLMKLLTSHNSVSFDLEACSLYKLCGSWAVVRCDIIPPSTGWHCDTGQFFFFFFFFPFSPATPLSSHLGLLLPTTSQQLPFQKTRRSHLVNRNVYMWVLLVELQQ